MDKKNVWIAGGIIAVLFIFILIFGINEIRGIVDMVFVTTDHVLPETEDAEDVIVLSSEGYSTDSEDFKVFSGKLYVSLDYVNTHYAGDRFFLDQASNMVIYTNSTQILNCTIGQSYDLAGSGNMGGSATFLFVENPVSEESSEDSASVLVPVSESSSEESSEETAEEVLPEGTAYILADQVTDLYGVEFRFSLETQVLILQEEMTRYVTVQDPGYTVYLKAYPEEGAPLLTVFGMDDGYQVYRELAAGETLYVYGEDENYYQVADESGILGYVAKDAVGEVQYQEETTIVLDSYEMPEELRLDSRISVIWDYYSTGNGYFDDSVVESYAGTEDALTVLAPIWLHVWEDDEGNPMIQNSNNQEYIDWAHQQGYKVWVTLENVDNTFEDIDEKLYELLSNTETRQALVQQMLQWYQEYGFDGMNVDLEDLEDRVGPYFVQFMRELSAVLRPAGCMLTVDLGVPSEWTAFYDRETMGRVCDYVCLMAYDEHYAGDTTAGSVASYPWVLNGVQNSLTEGIDASKLVLCMPLYTRFWILDSSGEVMTDRTDTVPMQQAWDTVTENWGVEPQWDDSTGQYYAETVYSDGSRVQVWLEDVRSMQMRIDLAAEQNLGGVAMWYKGWETTEILDAVASYLDGGQ